MDPLIIRWDRTVIPATPGDDTIVCCLTDDGRPVALILDYEHREALGLQLVDPEGDLRPLTPDCRPQPAGGPNPPRSLNE